MKTETIVLSTEFIGSPMKVTWVFLLYHFYLDLLCLRLRIDVISPLTLTHSPYQSLRVSIRFTMLPTPVRLPVSPMCSCYWGTISQCWGNEYCCDYVYCVRI